MCDWWPSLLSFLHNFCVSLTSWMSVSPSPHHQCYVSHNFSLIVYDFIELGHLTKARIRPHQANVNSNRRQATFVVEMFNKCFDCFGDKLRWGKLINGKDVNEVLTESWTDISVVFHFSKEQLENETSKNFLKEKLKITEVFNWKFSKVEKSC